MQHSHVLIDAIHMYVFRLEKLDQQRSKQQRVVPAKTTPLQHVQAQPSSSTPPAPASRAARAALLLQNTSGTQRQSSHNRAPQPQQVPPLKAASAGDASDQHAVCTPLAQLVDKHTLQATPLAKVGHGCMEHQGTHMHSHSTTHTSRLHTHAHPLYPPITQVLAMSTPRPSSARNKHAPATGAYLEPLIAQLLATNPKRLPPAQSVIASRVQHKVHLLHVWYILVVVVE